MKKISIIIVLILALISCATNKFGTKSPAYISSFKTLYNENFEPYYVFSVTNNSSKIITNVEVYIVYECHDLQTSKNMWQPRWDASIAPGQTQTFRTRVPRGCIQTSEITLSKFELNRIRYSDGTVYGN